MDCHNCTIGDEFESVACQTGGQNRECSVCTATNCVSSGNYQQACTTKCTTAIEQGGFGFDSCGATSCTCNAGPAGARTSGSYINSTTSMCVACTACGADEFESGACQNVNGDNDVNHNRVCSACKEETGTSGAYWNAVASKCEACTAALCASNDVPDAC